MNWDTIAGNWKQVQGKVRQQWGKLTDDDLELIKGKRDELAGRIQDRYGIAKDEAERKIDEWDRTSEADVITGRPHQASVARAVRQAAHRYSNRRSTRRCSGSIERRSHPQNAP